MAQPMNEVGCKKYLLLAERFDFKLMIEWCHLILLAQLILMQCSS